MAGGIQIAQVVARKAGAMQLLAVDVDRAALPG
jgi:hypothetical protein